MSDHEFAQWEANREAAKADFPAMPWGEYQGDNLLDLPPEYLDWLSRRSWEPWELGPEYERLPEQCEEALAWQVENGEAEDVWGTVWDDYEPGSCENDNEDTRRIAWQLWKATLRDHEDCVQAIVAHLDCSRGAAMIGINAAAAAQAEEDGADVDFDEDDDE